MEPVDGAYRTPRGLRIAADAVSWIATRSGGPGGQHANTTDTAVTITIDVDRAGLSTAVHDRVVAVAGPTITASSAASRSQFRNRATAWAAALERLDEAAKPPPPARRQRARRHLRSASGWPPSDMSRRASSGESRRQPTSESQEVVNRSSIWSTT